MKYTKRNYRIDAVHTSLATEIIKANGSPNAYSACSIVVSYGTPVASFCDDGCQFCEGFFCSEKVSLYHAKKYMEQLHNMEKNIKLIEGL